MLDSDAKPPRPEFYIDSYNLALSPYTVILDLAVRQGPEDVESLVRIRMSPEHAKAMAILFKRAIQDYERLTGVSIALPPELLKEKNIDVETDW